LSNVPDDSVASAIQACAVADLAAGAELAGVPVLGRRETNIANDIEQAINELGGACIYVLPGLPISFLATPGSAYADKYQVRIRCIESDTLNATLPPVQVLVERVVRRLYGRQWTAIEGMNPLMPIEGQAVVQQPDSDRLIYDVIMETSLGFLPRIGG
jgi:hypothetical protein